MNVGIVDTDLTEREDGKVDYLTGALVDFEERVYQSDEGDHGQKPEKRNGRVLHAVSGTDSDDGAENQENIGVPVD